MYTHTLTQSHSRQRQQRSISAVWPQHPYSKIQYSLPPLSAAPLPQPQHSRPSSLSLQSAHVSFHFFPFKLPPPGAFHPYHHHIHQRRDRWLAQPTPDADTTLSLTLCIICVYVCICKRGRYIVFLYCSECMYRVKYIVASNKRDLQHASNAKSVTIL